MLKQETQGCKEREFICPCGKSYFSYAALFTHVKQKHEGKPPGQIIKPKAENKRGRPRKNPLPSFGSTSSCPESKKLGLRGQDSCQQLRFNSGTDLNQNIFDIRCHSTSKFTLYKQDQAKLQTANEFYLEESFEDELLKDLSRYLQIREVVQVPEEVLKKIPASFYLAAQGDIESLTIDYLKRFLGFCMSGLKRQTYTQLFLLLSMLLEHIIQIQNLTRLQDLQISSFHEHIVSFFSFIAKTSRDIDLKPYIIFNDLNTIKSLIVFFNWLSKIEVSDSTTKQEESESQE